MSVGRLRISLRSVAVAAMVLLAIPRRALADDPPAAPPPTPVFVESKDHLTLLERTPRGDYVTVCDAPCRTELAPGRFQGAVSHDGDRFNVDDIMIPRQPARLKLRFDSGRGVRAGGWILFGLGVAGSFGSFIMYGWMLPNVEDPGRKPAYGWLAAGLVSAGLSACGLAIALTGRDTASIDVVSSAGSSSPARVATPAGPAFSFSF